MPARNIQTSDLMGRINSKSIMGYKSEEDCTKICNTLIVLY